jgi:hypothetical protein
MVEDVYEMVASLEQVEPVLVIPEGLPADHLSDLTWPGTAVVRVPAQSASPDILIALAELGADELALIVGDAPDLPPLLVGKLYRGLGSAEVALLPASGGGLVALATRCPPPPWLVRCGAGLDVQAAQALVQHAAPRRSAVSVGPGWHRVRERDDLQLLDPGLEGWDVTQAALRDQAPGARDG